MIRLTLFYASCVLSVLYPVTAFPCLDIKGEWRGSYHDVPWCDGYTYSGTWSSTVFANCNFSAVNDEGTVAQGSVNQSTKKLNASGNDECGRFTLAGTFTSSTVSGTYSYDIGGSGFFSGSLVNPTADLSITKSDSPDPVMIENPFSYTLRVANSGPNIATSVRIQDTLPVGVTYMGASGSGWSCTRSNRTVTCSRSSLGLTTAPDITIQASAPASAGTITNIATVSAATYDPNSSNDSASAATIITLIPELTDPAPGSTLSSDMVTFSWSANGSQVTNWRLYIGNSAGGEDIYVSDLISPATTSITVPSIPVDGRTLHVRLSYQVGDWLFRDYQFSTDPTVNKAAIVIIINSILQE